MGNILDWLVVTLILFEVLALTVGLYLINKKEDYTTIKAMTVKMTLIIVGIHVMYITKYLIVGEERTVLDGIFGSLTMFDMIVGVLSVVITLDIFKIGIDIQEVEQRRKVEDELKYIVAGYKGLLKIMGRVNKDIETIVLFEYKEGKRYEYYHVSILGRELDNIYKQIQGIRGFMLGKQETNLPSDLHGTVTEIWEVIEKYQKEIEGYLKSESRQRQEEDIHNAYITFYHWVKAGGVQKNKEVPMNSGGNFYTDLYKVNKELIDVVEKYLNEIDNSRGTKEYQIVSIRKQVGIDKLVDFIEHELAINRILKTNLKGAFFKHGEQYLGTLFEGETYIIEYPGARHTRKETLSLIHEHSETYNVKVKQIEVVSDYTYLYVEFETIIVVYEKCKERESKEGILVTIFDECNNNICEQVQSKGYFFENIEKKKVIVSSKTEDEINLELEKIYRVKYRYVMYNIHKNRGMTVNYLGREEQICKKTFTYTDVREIEDGFLYLLEMNDSEWDISQYK